MPLSLIHISNPDKTDLIEAFYKDLEFGTGGLRGIMGVGSNRCLLYTSYANAQAGIESSAMSLYEKDPVKAKEFLTNYSCCLLYTSRCV